MYLPDPLLALVALYLTDGQPALRALAGCCVARTTVKGWQAMHAKYRGDKWWSVIRYALDLAAYMVHVRTASSGWSETLTYKMRMAPIRRIALIVRPGTAREMAEMLMGTWCHPPSIQMPEFSYCRLIYAYSPCLINADIISVDEYVKWRHIYEYFIFWNGVRFTRDQVSEINKAIAAGRGKLL